MTLHGIVFPEFLMGGLNPRRGLGGCGLGSKVGGGRVGDQGVGVGRGHLYVDGTREVLENVIGRLLCTHDCWLVAAFSFGGKLTGAGRFVGDILI